MPASPHPYATVHAPSPYRGRAIRWLAALYIATAIAVALQRTLISTENNFLIFRAAFVHLAGGQDLYAAWPALHADFFKYSPTFALLFAPFALLPAVPGYALWAMVCALTVFAAVVRLLPERQAVVALAWSWLSVVGDLQRAQSNALCAGLMVLAWVAFERRNQWSAAGAIAAGAFIKLFPLAALAGAVFHPRRIRFGLIFVAVLAIGAALPLLVTSRASLALQYASWRSIEMRDAAPLPRYGTGGADLYAGLMGQFRVWLGVQWPHWPTQLAGVLVLLAPLPLRRRRWSEPHFRILLLASILVFCVLFNHQAESPSYAIAMIGTSIWFAASDRAWWRTGLMIASLLIVNVGSTDLMPRAWYHDFYVTYLLKTVPLIPVWLAMQGELLGLIATNGRSEGPEADQRQVAAPQALAHGG